MSKGKLEKFAEMEQFPHVFQFPFKTLSESGFPLKGKWKTKFFKNENPVVLELGCGKGEYTVGLAKEFRDKNFIGVDIKGARIWKGAKDSFEASLPNVAFIRTNIEIVDFFFATNEVDEIWLTFPDPQMKKARKRLTATNFVELYLKFLKTGGPVHLKTDSNFQYQYTCEMIKKNNFPIVQQLEDVHKTHPTDSVLQIRTHYESQWMERGIPIKYIAFVPEIKELEEPDVEIEFDAYRSYGRTKATPKTHGK